MAQLTDWLYDALKNSDLGRRADENRNRRQQGAGPAVSIPGVDWAALDASRSPLGSALGATTRAPYGVAGQDPFAAPFPTEGQEYFAPTSSRFDPFLMMGMAPPQVPQSRSDLTTRSVATIPIDRDGNPIVGRDAVDAQVDRLTRPGTNPGWGAALGSIYDPVQYEARFSSLPTSHGPPSARQQITQTAMLPYPEDSRTTEAPPTQTAAQGPTYFPTGTGQYGYNALTGDYEVMQPGNAYTRGTLPPNTQGNIPQNPAVGAIDQATGMPRPRPGFVQPLTPSPMLRGSLVPTGEALPGATNFDGSPVEIMVRGGSKQNPPPVPMPRFVNNRGQAVTPQMGTFYNPDTNKFEQRQVFRPAPSGKGVPAVPLPRKRPPVNGSKNVSGPPVGMTVDEVGAFRYHG